MGRIIVDPTAESASGFPVWAPGRYTLRILEVEEATTKAGKPMLVITHEAVGDVFDEQGNALTNAGRLWDRVTVDPIVGKNGNQVSFLRPLIESAGLPWSDFNPEDLVGKEVTAQVGVGEYQGRKLNKVARYIIKGA